MHPPTTTSIANALAAWWLPLLAAPFVGSFLGVLIKRLPAGEQVVLGRSRCERCRRPLRAYEMIPVISWLALRCRCRSCGAPLGWFYPGIEVAALMTAAWAASETEGWLLWASCVLGWALLALAVIDLRDMILPDALTLPLVALGVFEGALLQGGLPIGNLIGAAGGYAAFFLVARTYRLLRGREGLGAGDAKLLAAAGAWISWQGLPSVVLEAAMVALLVIAVRGAFGETPSRRQRLAFGPYLCLGTWLVWLYGPLMIE